MTLALSGALTVRHAQVRRLLVDASIDALVVSHLPNIFYLTNFSGSSAIAVLTQEALHFVTDFRYMTALSALQASPSACPDLVVCQAAPSYEETLVARLAALAVPRVGFEAAHLTVSRLRWMESMLRDGPRVDLVPTEGIVEHARLRKDDGEQATLREAARRLSAVLQGVLADVRAGLTEIDVALGLETGMRRTGFTRPAFDTIVASGPNSALPHARAGDRRLGNGDLVVLDFGGVYNGYCVDLTRTVAIGPPAPRRRGSTMPSACAGSGHRSRGTRCGDRRHRPGSERRVGRRWLRRGVWPRHRAWPRNRSARGAARGAREPGERGPGVSSRARARGHGLEAGMVFTIEPGAYLPDWGACGSKTMCW